MKTNKETLDIIIESLTDDEWQDIKRNREVRQAFQKAEVFTAKRNSAIQFGDWILSYNILPSYNDEGSACWVVADGSGKTYSSTELYNAYINRDFEDDENDDNWDY